MSLGHEHGLVLIGLAGPMDVVNISLSVTLRCSQERSPLPILQIGLSKSLCLHISVGLQQQAQRLAYLPNTGTFKHAARQNRLAS